jgi:hypothetical protein
VQHFFHPSEPECFGYQYFSDYTNHQPLVKSLLTQVFPWIRPIIDHIPTYSKKIFKKKSST